VARFPRLGSMWRMVRRSLASMASATTPTIIDHGRGGPLPSSPRILKRLPIALAPGQ
jgi:hypothetical protein